MKTIRESRALKKIKKVFQRKNFLCFCLLAATFLLLLSLRFEVLGTTNIDSQYHWAWNDSLGWIDFSYDDVNVYADRLEGYVSSSVGIISLNCNETGNPEGINYCPQSDYKVENDTNGNLSGFAWNDTIGWISFNCQDLGVCDVSDYKVTIDNTGDFHGWAWNDIVGWISFNCQEPGICDYSDYKVKTAWTAGYATSGELLSLIIDTEEQQGTVLTGIVWKGTIPTGASVKFELGSSNSTSSDSFSWTGPYDSVAWRPDWWQVSIPLADLTYHNNHRYIRYKVVLTPTPDRQQSPQIEKIVLRWSK